MITKQEIKKLVKKIAQRFKPEKIILFGSFAWGQPSEDSDVDLLIIKKTDLNLTERNTAVRKIINGSLPADILVYTPEEINKIVNKNGNLFIEDILKNGKTLYKKLFYFSRIKLPSRPLKIITQ